MEILCEIYKGQQMQINGSVKEQKKNLRISCASIEASAEKYAIIIRCE